MQGMSVDASITSKYNSKHEMANGKMYEIKQGDIMRKLNCF